MKKPATIAVVVILTFLVALVGPRLLALWLPVGSWPVLARTLYTALWWLGLPLLALGGLHGFQRALPELGWQASVGQGLAVGLGCTLPMLVGFAVLFPLNAAAGPVLALGLVRGALWAGLGEETLFRGFLFGQLYRRARWPWLLTILLESGIFSLGHLYQSHDWLSAAAVLGITFGGGVWFGWLYKSWNNLWVPIFLHVFMNGWWMLFDVSDTTIGGISSNVLRVLTIGLSVVLTRWHLRRQPASAAPAWPQALRPQAA